MATAGVALGSNLDPELNVPVAIARLQAREDLRVIAQSSVYATPSIGPDGAPDGNPEFHNAVVLLTTGLGPIKLRARLRAIEEALGRVRTADRFAPRPIDLDIVFYDTVVMRTESVTIPDPDALRLAHLVVPLADVAPDWRPPGEAMGAAQAAEAHELTVVA